MPFKRMFGPVVCAGAGVLAVLCVGCRSERTEEHERKEPAAATSRAASEGGERLIALDRDTQARVAMKTEVLGAATLQPEVVAFGRLEEDPAQSFTLRSPIAGMLRRTGGRDWPNLGETLVDGAEVALIEPRFSPADRVSLASQLVQARASVEETSASLAAARASYDHKKSLNVQDRIVTERAMEEAEAKVKAEEARFAAAKETVRLIEEALAAEKGPTRPGSLKVERGGEVVEALARPGESVESGQPLLRVVRFDRLFARIVLPAGDTVDASAGTARIVVIGQEDRPLRGEKVAMGSTAGPGSQGQMFLFRVTPGALPLRPGMAATAYVPAPGAPLKGVAIPRSAVVRLAGRAWAYAQVGEEKFSRREVGIEHPVEDGWFMTAGFAPGDRVVAAGAQTLLSEELKAEIESE